MPYDPARHHRRSIRLRGYDYARAGAYFVTIVMQGRECLLGNVAEGEMALNDAGRMIEKWWGEHLDRGEHAGGEHAGSPLPTIIQWFKTMTTNEYIRGVKQLGWPPFPGKLWQRNYYEHIIRDERDLERIRAYIANNPHQWAVDAENPARAKP